MSGVVPHFIKKEKARKASKKSKTRKARKKKKVRKKQRHESKHALKTREHVKHVGM